MLKMIFDYPLFGPLAQVAFVFGIAPLLVGVMRKVKARFQRRDGAPIYQPYLDLAKLFFKGTVTSADSSWIFTAAPAITFASVIVAAAILPVLSEKTLLVTDLILFLYLFAIGRFLTALSALDIASAFGGLGASREMFYSVVIEPALFAVMLFLATADGNLGLAPLSAYASAAWPAALYSPAHWLAGAALFIIILAELGRLPFDNPATHLELTMVHEAMILDQSGPLLALTEWAQAAKAVLFLGLWAQLFLPLPALMATIGGAAYAVAFAALLLLLGALVATVESLTPKLRLFKITRLLVFSAALSLVAFFARVWDLRVSGQLDLVLAFVMLVCSLYFLLSATFRRRLVIYFIQSSALAIILLNAALASGEFDSYLRLATTIILKLVIVPWLLWRVLKTLSGESKMFLNIDPIYDAAPITSTFAVMLSALLVFFAFVMTPVLGIKTLLLPVAMSIVLVGGLIISLKTHVLLQLMGFLMLENGLVLLPTALGLNIPLLGEITVLFDTVMLLVTAIMLAFKIRGSMDSLNVENLNSLTERK